MSQARVGSSLTQTAFAQLRAEILACRLQPGERLKIGDLCQSLGANLSAIREALSRLTAEGLVIAEPQRGFRVAPISQADLTDLTTVRIEIEGMCLRRAVAAGDVTWESRVVAAFHRLTRTPERSPGDARLVHEAWAEAHAEFHAALAGACDSPWLLRLRGLLYDQSERYRRLSVPLASAERDTAHEHREIMRAAVARRADLAVALMAEHLRLTTRLLLGSQRTTDPAVA